MCVVGGGGERERERQRETKRAERERGGGGGIQAGILRETKTETDRHIDPGAATSNTTAEMKSIFDAHPETETRKCVVV